MPARPRDRLAALILAALCDPGARRDLAAVAGGEREAVARCVGEDANEWIDLVRERARGATLALASAPVVGAGPEPATALARAAVLFDAGLFFEVHELLEPHWTAASGRTRDALQGLIQIAVGLQHLANHNVRGAQTLLREGCERLARGAIAGLDLADFAGAIATGLASGVDSFRAGTPRFPRRD